MEKDLEKNLNEQEKKTVDKLGKRKMIKLIKNLTKSYNQLCNDCKLKIISDPKRLPDDYCEDCRNILFDATIKSVGDDYFEK